jgi:acyl carrier protein
VATATELISRAAGREVTTVELVEVTRAAIAAAAETDVAGVHDELRFEDLGLDSFAFTEILLNLEEALDIELPIEILQDVDADAAEVATIGQFFALFFGQDG